MVPTRSPRWMRNLVNRILDRQALSEENGEWRWIWATNEENAGRWLVGLYPTPLEVVGGRFDGQKYTPPYTLDITAVLKELDLGANVAWHSRHYDPNTTGPRGSFLQIIGRYKKRPVDLRFYALPERGCAAVTVIEDATGTIRRKRSNATPG